AFSTIMMVVTLALAGQLRQFLPAHFIEEHVVNATWVLNIQSPYNLILGGTAFLVLVFVVQALVGDDEARSPWTDAALGVAAATLTLLIITLITPNRVDSDLVCGIALGFAALALLVNRTRPTLLAGLVLGMFVIVFLQDRIGERVIDQERSFFGILKVKQFD